MTVAVVGLGFLGRGIATCLLGQGMRVVGYSRRRQSHEQAHRHMQQGLSELVEHAGADPSLLTLWQERYQSTNRWDDLEPCQFVIESVAEDETVKQAVFTELERVVGNDVPIASNTSAISISQLQQSRENPGRFLGMHWAEPAHATRFLELIRGAQTTQETMLRAQSFARCCGKEPSVLTKDIPGFIANRLGYAMYREAFALLEAGVADVETIDRSFRNACGLWATMCGPFRWIDLTGGPALYAKAMAGVLPTLCNDTELPASLREFANEDARGIVNGHGFYDYTPEQAAAAEALYRRHAWKVHQLMDEYFPLEKD